MADEILESGQQAGSEGTDNSAASQNVGDKPTSQFSAEELLKQLEPLIERKVQSVKDRRFDEQGKRIAELSQFQPVLERFKDLVSPEQLREIQKDLEFEDLKRRVYGDGQTSEPVSAVNTQVPAVNAAKTFVEMGLDLSDPRVSTEAVKQFANEDAVIAAGWRLQQQLKNSPTPTEAQSASLQGKQTVTSHDTLLAEMNELEKGNDFQAIKAKAEELRQAGVPGWT